MALTVGRCNQLSHGARNNHYLYITPTVCIPAVDCLEGDIKQEMHNTLQ